MSYDSDCMKCVKRLEADNERLRRELDDMRHQLRSALDDRATAEREALAANLVITRALDGQRYVRLTFPDYGQVEKSEYPYIAQQLAREAAHMLLQLAREEVSLAERCHLAESNIMHLLPFEKLPPCGPNGLDWRQSPGAKLVDANRALQVKNMELERKLREVQTRESRRMLMPQL